VWLDPRTDNVLGTSIRIKQDVNLDKSDVKEILRDVLIVKCQWSSVRLLNLDNGNLLACAS